MDMNARNQYLNVLKSRLENIRSVIIINLVTIFIKEIDNSEKLSYIR